MDEIDQELKDSQKAKELINNPVLIKAFEELEKLYLDTWKSSDLKDSEGREVLWQLVWATAQVRAHLDVILERGELHKAQLNKLHPDMNKIIQDKKFQEWVTASKVRQKLFHQADKMYDYETADELLNLWKDRQQTVKQTAQTEKKERKQAVKAASTGTTKGSTAPSSKKIYRRADIIKLMKEDPDRYQSLSGEIMQAYAERRVR